MPVSASFGPSRAGHRTGTVSGLAERTNHAFITVPRSAAVQVKENAIAYSKALIAETVTNARYIK